MIARGLALSVVGTMVLLGCIAYPAGAAAGPTRCAAKGSTTVTSNRSVRVFRTRARAVVACRRATGQRTRLQDVQLGFFRPIVVDGLVGFQSFNALPDGTVITNVEVFDVRRRRLIVEVPAFQGSNEENFQNGTPGIGKDAFSLQRDGYVAWIAPTPAGSFEVHRASPKDGSGFGETLDAGADVDPSSLALGRRYIYWQRGGVAKSVTR